MTRIPIDGGEWREDREPERGEAGEEGREYDAQAGASREAPREPDDVQSVSLESRIRQVQQELEAKEQDAKRSFDRLLRVQAEFENYKKRMQRDKEELARYGGEKVLREFLPIVDNLYRALEAGKMGGDFDSLKAGLELIRQQIEEVLHRLGVRGIKSLGQPFDPTVHEAVIRVDSPDHEDNTVVDELERGYFLQDRILRPAKVAVCKKSEEPAEGQ